MQLQHAAPREQRAGIDRLGERVPHEGEVVGQRAENLVGEERVDVVVARLVGGPVPQPPGRPPVLAGELGHLVLSRVAVGQADPLELLEQAGEPIARFGQPLGEFTGEGPSLGQQLDVLVGARVRRVIEQQDDAQVRIFLQGSRQQRLTNGLDLFAVRRHQHRHGGQGGVERVVNHGARHPAVGP